MGLVKEMYKFTTSSLKAMPKPSVTVIGVGIVSHNNNQLLVLKIRMVFCFTTSVEQKIYVAKRRQLRNRSYPAKGDQSEA